MFAAYDSDDDPEPLPEPSADKPKRKVVALGSLPVSRKVDVLMDLGPAPVKKQRVDGPVDLSSARGILASLPKAASTKSGAACMVRIEPLKREVKQEPAVQIESAPILDAEPDEEDEGDVSQPVGSFFTLPDDEDKEEDDTDAVLEAPTVGPIVPQGYDATETPTWKQEDVKAVSRQSKDDMLASHPLVKAGMAKEAIAGMTEKELRELSGAEVCKGLTDLHHTQLPNTGWKYENYKPASGSEILLSMKGKDLVTQAYCTEAQKAIRVSAPTITQKRKSQINWLAADAQANEAKLQQHMSEGRLTKSQTYMKYGW